MQCEVCPRGATCTVPGLRFVQTITIPLRLLDRMICLLVRLLFFSLEELVSRDGWWRSDNRSTDFFQCLQTGQCVSGGCAEVTTAFLFASFAPFLITLASVFVEPSGPHLVFFFMLVSLFLSDSPLHSSCCLAFAVAAPSVRRASPRLLATLRTHKPAVHAPPATHQWLALCWSASSFWPPSEYVFVLPLA
jgi:hypothetical protein